MATKHIVHLIESEAGWGQRIDEVLEFDTYKEAEDRVEEFNGNAKDLHTPDWYMFAEYIGTKEVDVDEPTVAEMAEIMKKLVYSLECRIPDHPSARLAKEYLDKYGLLS